MHARITQATSIFKHRAIKRLRFRLAMMMAVDEMSIYGAGCCVYILYNTFPFANQTLPSARLFLIWRPICRCRFEFAYILA